MTKQVINIYSCGHCNFRKLIFIAGKLDIIATIELHF